MVALIAIAYNEDVRLERKLSYDFAKLKAKVQLRVRLRSHYAPAVPIAPSSYWALAEDPSASPITGEKRKGLEVDPDHSTQKHLRHLNNFAEGVSRTPLSSQTQASPHTSPDTGIGHTDEEVAETSPHRTVCFHTRQAKPVVASGGRCVGRR